MLISNKLHSFRNFQMQIYANCFKLTNDCCTKNVQDKRFHKKF